MKQLCGWIPIYLLVLIAPAKAAQLTENFASRSHFASGTAVWNQAYSVLHPTLRVMNFKPGFTPLEMPVGDGSDGAFEPGNYERFSENGDLSGNIIRFNTDTHPILQVTRFELAQGWFLVPVGSNPLIIHSLSYVFIQGEIWCNGENGGDSSGATPGVGGRGRCGGKNGGDGGAPHASGIDGENANGSVTGGQAGDYAAGSFVGGGGGGAWNATPATVAENGPNFSVNGGTAGTSSANPDFTTILGSAGGGGGGGGDATAGGGGGGGGGVVIIHAVGDVWIGDSGQNYGFIYAYGGKGGDADTGAGDAGPGGGGGGGSIQIFSGSTINIYNGTAGSSDARRGLGGTNSSAASGAAGSNGRSWLASVNSNYAAGSFLPAYQAPLTGGNVEYNSATQTIETVPLDLGNTLATVTSLDMNPVSTDFLLEVAGSSDGFASDDTGWTTNLALLAEKRFIKFKISITTSDVNTPTLFSSASVTYDPGKRTDFDFKAAGCGNIGAPPTPPFNTLILFLIPLLFLKGARRLFRPDFGRKTFKNQIQD